jgi:hypothetical protein
MMRSAVAGGDARISVARLVVAAAGEVGRNRRKLALLADLENRTHARVQVEQDVAVDHPESYELELEFVFTIFNIFFLVLIKLTIFFY